MTSICKNITECGLSAFGRLKCDIFGAGAITQAAASVAAASINAEAQRDTNISNERIHKEDRDFNAAEAEKTRLWESAGQRMERNIEAGINPVLGMEDVTGGQSSGAQASSPSPIPMQAPQIDLSGVAQGVNAAIQIAKVGAEKSKLNADTKQALQQAKILEIQSTKELDKLQVFLDDKSADIEMKRAAARNYSATTSQLLAQTWSNWVHTQKDIADYNVNIDVIKHNAKMAGFQFQSDIDKFLADATSVVRSSSYNSETLKKHIEQALDREGYGSNSHFSENHSKGTSLLLGGEASAELAGKAGFTGVLPSGEVSAKGGIKLYGNWSQNSSDSELSGFGDSKERSNEKLTNQEDFSRGFKATSEARKIVEASIYARLLELEGLSNQQVNDFTSRLSYFTTSYLSYKSWFETYATMPGSNPNSQGDGTAPGPTP